MTPTVQLLFALLIASPGIVEPKKTRLACEIAQMDACRLANNAVVFATPASTSMRGREYVTNGFFNITRTVKRIGEIRLDLVRCRDSVSSNTCEHFASWRLVSNPCKAFMSQGAPWSAIVSSIHPNISCPHREGAYKLVDTTLDMRVLEGTPLPLEGSVWQSRTHHLEPSGALHACFESTYIFHRIRA